MYRCICSRMSTCYSEMWQRNDGVQRREKGEKEKPGIFRITGDVRKSDVYDASMHLIWFKKKEVLKSSSYRFFWFSQTNSRAFSDLLIEEHSEFLCMCTEVINQPVYLFIQLTVNCIRYKIDKYFCPTEGYISAGKDRKGFIQMQWDWKQCFRPGFWSQAREKQRPQENQDRYQGNHQEAKVWTMTQVKVAIMGETWVPLTVRKTFSFKTWAYVTAAF